MVTIHRESGFEVMIYKDDHEPAHVHVWKGNDEAKINLLDTILVYTYMTKADTSKVKKLVKKNREKFLEKWREIHG